MALEWNQVPVIFTAWSRLECSAVAAAIFCHFKMDSCGVEEAVSGF